MANPQFKPSYLNIESEELVEYLLKESGSRDSSCANIEAMLEILKLQCVEMDFKKAFDTHLRLEDIPRALISFPDQIIAIEKDMYDRRKRFCCLHEIAHYVLPEHRHDLFICKNKDFSVNAEKEWEVQANAFAADLLFLGGEFEKEANQYSSTSAKLIKDLGDKYNASYEATARRLVSKNQKPCMLLIIYKQEDNNTYPIKYCVSSKSFKLKYFSDITGELSPDIAQKVLALDNISKSMTIINEFDTYFGKYSFNSELFTNSKNIFVLITPKLD
jgi:Zn-dependent peptidase ImmA (M78 family)